MKEYKFTINENPYQVSVQDLDNQNAVVCVNGVEYTVQYAAEETAPAVEKAAVEKPAADKPAADKPAAAGPEANASANTSAYEVCSPLPGIILDLHCRVGDSVRAGQALLVLEAMKMENVIEAEKDGKVLEVKVAKGDSVLEGAVLLTIG